MSCSNRPFTHNNKPLIDSNDPFTDSNKYKHFDDLAARFDNECCGPMNSKIDMATCNSNAIEEEKYSTHSSNSQPENGMGSQDSKMECDKDLDEVDNKCPVYQKTTEPLEKKTGRFNPIRKIKQFYCSIRDSVSEFTQRQWKTLIVLCIGTLTSSLSVCLFPPFFPRLAESKGESATIYGLVIGTNCLTAFLITPIIGKKLNIIGVNFAFIAGIFGSGACCCLSGLLEYFPSGSTFVLMAICIRICHATSNAAVITSTMAFIANEFPHSVAFLFSLTRATMNLAQMFGPIIGGALHTFGGFKMPFFVLGGFQILMCPLCFCLLPVFKDMKKRKETRNLWSILKVPGLWVSFITFIFSTMSNGFLSITLEPRIIRKLNLSPLYVGVLFGLKDGANCISSPIWGWTCEKTSQLKLLIIVGSVLAAGSFILLGPFPGIPLEQTTIGIVVFSLILNGIGIGGQQVAGVANAMRDAVYAGYPDEPDTHAFIASLWSSLSGGGRFISRTGSGVLVDTIGFRATSSIVTFLHLAVIIVCITYMLFYKTNNSIRNSSSDRDQLVETERQVNNLNKSPAVAIPTITDFEGSYLVGSTQSRTTKRHSRHNPDQDDLRNLKTVP